MTKWEIKKFFIHVIFATFIASIGTGFVILSAIVNPGTWWIGALIIGIGVSYGSWIDNKINKYFKKE
jgi:hypothetical protein